MEVFTKSAKETKSFGGEFASKLKGGETLALVGGLGSGKTTFVQGLAEGFGVGQQIISPTFILLRQYEAKGKNFIHVDLYRLEEKVDREIVQLGLTDMWGRPENIVIVEWADKARDAMPPSAIWITFEQLDDVTRKIIIK